MPLMIVLGVDPGIARTGWGVVEKHGGVKATDYGCIKTKKHLSEEKRLLLLYSELNKLIKKYKPAVVSVEKLFFSSNAKTAIIVGQARGVVLLCAGELGLPVFSYTPLRIKMAMTGYGRADKVQIQKMVQSMLGLDKVPKPDDAADALAVAITHIYTKDFS